MIPPFPVTLTAFDPAWLEYARQLSEQLLKMGPAFVAIHHIGSTAVPGLIAKPIIDLMPVVVDLEAVDLLRPKIERLGYHWHGEYGIEGRRYCYLSDHTGRRLAQLHIFQIGSPHITRHLAFRDYLRAFSKKAAAYADVKAKARDLHPLNSHDYSNAKSDWVKTTEIEALNWFEN